MATEKSIAVFGIGSTNFRYAVGRPDGTFVTDVHVEPTRPEGLCVQAISCLETLQSSGEQFDAVSIACAGLIDDGIVAEIDTQEGEVVTDIPLGPSIEAEFGVPVRVENDCTAAALAEWTYGAGRERECVVHLTIGTGIGAGVVDRGHLLRGAGGQAAEVGLFSIAPRSRHSCGVPGAWEAYCSGRGIAGFVRERLRTESRETVLSDPAEPTARDLFDAVESGDDVAEAYLEELGRYNAAGLGAVINAYNPDLITIGGGVGASNFEAILERVEPHLEAFTLPAVPAIEPTPLGDEIGLYGALAGARLPEPEAET